MVRIFLAACNKNSAPTQTPTTGNDSVSITANGPNDSTSLTASTRNDSVSITASGSNNSVSITGGTPNNTVSIVVNGKNTDLSKMVQPCSIDGAKVAGLKAGEGQATMTKTYAQDNNCSANTDQLNQTYSEYYTKGQQLQSLGIKVN